MAVLDAAACVLVGAVEGLTLTPAEEQFYRRVPVSGVTLFSRNIPATQMDLLGLTTTLQATRSESSPPLLIAIDQEGGRVARLKAPFPNAGPAMHLGGGGTSPAALQDVRSAALQLGQRLRMLGINANFAPVCDVLSEPNNDAIGDRAFSTDATAASLRSGAFLDGLIAAGILGCLKHFPGQGDARIDTHLGGARIDATLAQLEARELVPFRTLLPRAAMVMMSHCVYPQLSPQEASRSAWIMNDLLRQRLGFAGVIVSDDMNMGAIPQDVGPWQEAIVEAVAAGADLVLVCRHLERCSLAYDALRAEAARSASFARRLESAARRVQAMRSHVTSIAKGA